MVRRHPTIYKGSTAGVTALCARIGRYFSESCIMTHFLVVTALGTDRAGIVSKVAAHISETGCNIVDSRLAILGNEFTFIMLLSGDWNAITRLESTLPRRSQELALISVMKRTTRHQPSQYALTAEVSLLLADRPGILAECTSFFSAQGCDIHALRSQTIVQAQQSLLQASFQLQLTDATPIAAFQPALTAFCQQLGVIEQSLQCYPSHGADGSLHSGDSSLAPIDPSA